jgi:hypothetical protein
MTEEEQIDNGEGTNPSTERKTLVWESGRTREDIGAHNFLILDVAYSDSREITDAVDNRLVKRAFVSTPIHPGTINPLITRIEDGFNVGDFDFELDVRTIDGISVTKNFRIHVRENWADTSMEILE